jgi:hypothetical protein
LVILYLIVFIVVPKEVHGNFGCGLGGCGLRLRYSRLFCLFDRLQLFQLPTFTTTIKPMLLIRIQNGPDPRKPINVKLFLHMQLVSLFGHQTLGLSSEPTLALAKNMHPDPDVFNSGSECFEFRIHSIASHSVLIFLKKSLTREGVRIKN